MITINTNSSGLPQSRGWIAVLTAILIAAASATSVQAASASAQRSSKESAAKKREDRLAAVRAGTATLDCGALCSVAFILQQQIFLRHYQKQQWEDLAVGVVAADWRQDLGYFYLAAAAEGMKQYDAADKYYRMAGSLATAGKPTDKCASVQNLCAGFVFPRDISNRLRGLAKVRQAAAAATVADARLAPTINARDMTLSTDAAGGAGLLAEAPQTLLSRYVASRFAGHFGPGNRAQEAAFGNQALTVFNPAAAKSSEGNEIARPREISQLAARLNASPPANRMTLGLYVQLVDYDMRSRSFTVRYPMFYDVDRISIGRNHIAGQSVRTTPIRGYSTSGTSCAWEPAQTFPRGDMGKGFFVVLTACIQHPPANTTPTQLSRADNEIPTAIALVPTGALLWSEFAMDPTQAEALITRMGPNRLVWAELVFDLASDIGQNYGGPFTQQTVAAKKTPPLTASIVPRALFLWDTSNAASPKIMGALGGAQNLGSAVNGQLTAAMIREIPVATAPAASPATAATPSATAAIAASSPQSPAKRAPAPARADDEWIVPPPAK